MQDTKQNRLGSYFKLIYPIMAGVCAFLATVIGSHFFTLSNSYLYIILGLGLFLLSNHLLYKLKFNSYHSNGATLTTVLVFVTQICCLALYKRQSIGCRWLFGVFLILFGTILIESGKKTKVKQEERDMDKKSMDKMD